MNKEKLKNLFKSKKMKKLLIYLGIAVVGIAAVVGVAIFMGASKLTLVNADPTVSDWCSERVEDSLFIEGADYLVKSCDCNVLGAIERKHGKTEDISLHSDAVLLDEYEKEFNTLIKDYASFMQEFVSYESRSFDVLDREYAYYADFYKDAIEIYLSVKDRSEISLLPIEITASVTDTSKSTLVGISEEYYFTFGSHATVTKESAANLFGYQDFTDLYKYARYNLIPALEDYLANGITEEAPFNPLQINGAIITEDGSLILPYIFINDENKAYALSLLIYEKSTDTIAVWFQDATIASTLLSPSNDPDAAYDATVTAYGRCVLFEKPKSVDLAAGSISGGGRYTSGSTKTIKAVANPGFTFKNWTNPDGSVASDQPEYTLEVPQSNLTLTANWNVTRQKLTLHVSPEDAEVSEFTVLTNTFFLTAPTREGYTFLGWKHKLTNLLGQEIEVDANDFVTTGTTSDVELWADWAKSRKITYHFSDADIQAGAYNNPENPSDFIVGKETTILEPTKNKEGGKGGKYVFDGWYVGSADGAKLKDNKIPADQSEDIELWAKWKTSINYYNIIKEGDVTYVELGAYPQKILDDQRTILKIKEKIATGQITPDPETGIFEYENTPYLRTKATPYQIDTYFSDGTAVEEEIEYFFIIEPIRWRVLSGDPYDPNSEVLLLSESVLDGHTFRDNVSPRSVDGKPVYANNWEKSDLRAYLNDEFLKAAFKEEEAKFIQNTTVDFSEKTAHYDRYANGGTCVDKVFLLSYADMINEKYGWVNVFTKEDDLKMAKATDYAKAQGVYTSLAKSKEYLEEHDSAHWWLCSPGDFEDSAALVTAPGTLGTYKVDNASIGIRPAITVKLGA